jgi:hypothetical protein
MTQSRGPGRGWVGSATGKMGSSLRTSPTNSGAFIPPPGESSSYLTSDGEFDEHGEPRVPGSRYHAGARITDRDELARRVSELSTALSGILRDLESDGGSARPGAGDPRLGRSHSHSSRGRSQTPITTSRRATQFFDSEDLYSAASAWSGRAGRGRKGSGESPSPMRAREIDSYYYSSSN